MIDLKAARALRHATMAEVAEKSGLNRSNLTQVENGKTQPSFEKMERILDALDMRLVVVDKNTGEEFKGVAIAWSPAQQSVDE